MSALLHIFGSARIACADDEATLWVRTDMETVSVELTPRNIEQLEAALAEARKYHAQVSA